jgi:hypothetical protein
MEALSPFKIEMSVPFSGYPSVRGAKFKGEGCGREGFNELFLTMGTWRFADTIWHRVSNHCIDSPGESAYLVVGFVESWC